MPVKGDHWGDRMVTKGLLGELILSLNGRDEFEISTIFPNFYLLINIIWIYCFFFVSFFVSFLVFNI